MLMVVHESVNLRHGQLPGGQDAVKQGRMVCSKILSLHLKDSRDDELLIFSGMLFQILDCRLHV